MSWDICAQNLPPGIKSIAEIPNDFVPGQLNLSRSKIIEMLSALYPESNFDDPSWGTLVLPGCSIEFSLGREEELRSFAMHVRGDERAPIVVAHILGHLGLSGIDPNAEGGLFELDANMKSESFARWLVYRSKFVG